MQRKPLVWEAHEYIYREKTSDWYWAVGVIAVSVAVISFIYANVLLGILILIGSFTLALFGSRRPKSFRFEINGTGILIGKAFYAYGTIDSFWIEDNTHIEYQSKLIFKSKSLLSPLMVIPLEDHDPALIRDYLLDHLPEEHHIEPISHKILEGLGF